MARKYRRDGAGRFAGGSGGGNRSSGRKIRRADRKVSKTQRRAALAKIQSNHQTKKLEKELIKNNGWAMKDTFRKQSVLARRSVKANSKYAAAKDRAQRLKAGA